MWKFNIFTGQFDDIGSDNNYVPYTGAVSNVDLGLHSLTVDTNSLFVDSVNHRIGIGTITPTATLHLKAGTATAGTTPIKFVSGTNTTVPEIGAVEFDGSDLFETSNEVVYDIDGNKYQTVVIGTQTWMVENLMTTKYKDGTAITRGPVGATWDGTDHGYYAYPPNSGNTAEETLANIQSNNLGFVYQWSAVNSGKLCPTGWHVPTDTEYCTLEQFVDPSISCSTTGWRGTNGGLLLKEAGTTHWTNDANVGLNTSGFTALGSGYRGTYGSFGGRSTSTYFWSSTVSGASAWTRYLTYSNATVNRNPYSQAYGFSVRCAKD